MDPKTQEANRKKLLEEKKRIEEALNVVSDADSQDHLPGDRTPKFPDYGDDNAIELEDNSPNEVADFARNIQITRDLDEELGRIKSALARLDAGNYGQCVKCGREIPEGRMNVYPAAETCIDCSKKT